MTASSSRLGRWRARLRPHKPWLIGAIAAALAAGLSAAGVWQPLERVGYNLLFQLRPPLHWNERLAIIAIDDASLEAYGQFQTWSRDRYTQLLTALDEAYPLVVGFDMLFADRSNADRDFAAASEALGTVVLARTWNEAGEPLEPIATLAEVAANQGHIQHERDRDGFSRTVPLWVTGPEGAASAIPNLGLAMLEVDAALREALGETPSVAALPEPSDRPGFQNVWINWPNRVEDVPTYSFADVAEGRFAPHDLQDKLVLVGFTATASTDPLLTPFNSNPPTSGVYLHAAVLDNLLEDRFLRVWPQPVAMLLLLPAGIAASLLLTASKRWSVRLGVILGLPLLWLAIALVALSSAHTLLPTAAPIGAILLAGGGVALSEQREKQQLMRLFETYVAPETANLIWQQRDQFFQNGELLAAEMTATVLFSDIRGFTTISEHLTPAETFRWLNRYLDAMTECIMAHGGVVDKYIGDAIMAVFGVPLKRTTRRSMEEDAERAIAASIAMHERLAQINEEFRQASFPIIRIGIGLHSGSVMAGSLGGARRLNYSVVGDTVNIAARLESLNKEVTRERPYNILVSRQTFAMASRQFLAEPVANIQLRGRQETTQIYTITGRA